jgi:hypothetical protein
MRGTHNRFEWHDLGVDALGVFSAWLSVIVSKAVFPTAKSVEIITSFGDFTARYTSVTRN